MSALQVQGDLLTFCLHAAVQPGEILKVRIEEHALELSVESCRQVSQEEYLVTARSPVPLEDQVDSVTVLGTRCEARIPERLRVMSAELPDYQALTRDISGGGLSLETGEPLQPGELLALNISFPGYDGEVASEVQVLWCRDEGGRYAAGCRFLDPGDLRLKAGLYTLQAPALPTPLIPPPRRLTRLAV